MRKIGHGFYALRVGRLRVKVWVRRDWTVGVRYKIVARKTPPAYSAPHVAWFV